MSARKSSPPSHRCENLDTRDYSFSPQINHRSRQLAKKALVKEESMIERLHRQHDARRARLLKAKEDQDVEEMKECSFQPNVKRFE